MFFLGSAYPLGKFGLNASMSPIFFGALRMGFVFLCLLPFCKIIIPKKKYILPLIGKMFSRDNAAYNYLPESVGAFPYGIELNKVIEKSGYNKAKNYSLTMGIASIYIAEK